MFWPYQSQHSTVGTCALCFVLPHQCRQLLWHSREVALDFCPCSFSCLLCVQHSIPTRLMVAPCVAVLAAFACYARALPCSSPFVVPCCCGKWCALQAVQQQQQVSTSADIFAGMVA